MGIKSAYAVERPVAHNRHAEHITDRDETVRPIILVIAGIRRIGAIVAEHENMALGHSDVEGKIAGLHAGFEIRAFIDGHAVDGHRLAGASACHGVARQADKPFDQVIAAHR